MVSLRNVILFLIIGAIFYYGWPIFEALIVKLPIPDPKDMKEKVTGVLSSIKERGKGSGPDSSLYKQGFEQRPESLNEDDDDDEQQPFGNHGKNGHNNTGLNYDSDEDKNQESELIDLDGGSNRDRTQATADKIPKLSKK